MAPKAGKAKARPRPRPKSRPKPAAKPRPKAKPSAAKAPPKVAKPSRPAPFRIAREESLEETVCSIEFLSDNRSFIARLNTLRGGMREHRAPSFTDLLELVAEDLREEFLEA